MGRGDGEDVTYLWPAGSRRKDSPTLVALTFVADVGDRPVALSQPSNQPNEPSTASDPDEASTPASTATAPVIDPSFQLASLLTTPANSDEAYPSADIFQLDSYPPFSTTQPVGRVTYDTMDLKLAEYLDAQDFPEVDADAPEITAEDLQQAWDHRLFPDARRETAYAKLEFPDGDYFLHHLQVCLGRNQDKALELRRRGGKKQHVVEDGPAAAQQTQEDGQDGAVDASLRGRPAPALPSAYSEQGGAVSIPHARSRKAAQRARRKSKTSDSVTSVAPANLHFSHATDVDDDADFVPIHPPAHFEHSIKQISRQHAIIFYNSDEERWQLLVKGRHVHILKPGEDEEKQFLRGSTANLGDGYRIKIAGLEIFFKLPPGAEVSSRASSPDVDATSPAAERLTDFIDNEDVAEDVVRLIPNSLRRCIRRKGAVMESPAQLDPTLLTYWQEPDKKIQPKLPSLKLKGPKAKLSQPEQGKTGVKDAKAPKPSSKPKKKDDKQHASPESQRKPDKGKKPMEAPAEPSAPAVPATAGDVTEVTPVVTTATTTPAPPEPNQGARPETPAPTRPQPIIEAGSVLEGVPAEYLPERRKGPGRPPKNGLISKRDAGFVKRRMNEYRKMGREPPPFNVVLHMVREENKQKEQAAKASARGETNPNPPEPAVVPSIETDPSLATTIVQEAESQPIPGTPSGPQPTLTPTEATKQSPPKSKQRDREISPVKPLDQCTEEELKKPNKTYVLILNEILEEHPQGRADLQEIYLLISKKYPYYAYRCESNGWQSSVRHNLQGNERFKDAGRAGKGKYWAIDYNFPLQKERRTRMTPPPQARPPQQYPPYGQQNYNPQYSQPGVNGGSGQYNGAPGNYYSPYGQGQPGQYGAGYGQTPPAGQPNGLPNQPPSQTPGAQQQNGSTQPPQPVPEQAKTPFQRIVDDIVLYMRQYVARWPEGPVRQEHNDVFTKCLEVMSAAYDHQRGSMHRGAMKATNAEEREIYETFERICEKHGALVSTNSATGTPAPPAGQGADGQASASASAQQSGAVTEVANAGSSGVTARLLRQRRTLLCQLLLSPPLHKASRAA
jgi:hypothetical protein